MIHLSQTNNCIAGFVLLFCLSSLPVYAQQPADSDGANPNAGPGGGALRDFTPFSGITTDGSLGAAVDLQGPNYVIPESLGQRNGANLFHSFERLGLLEGDSATFSGSAGLNNVVARVSGPLPSNVYGSIRVQQGATNFWLLNPNGIRLNEGAAFSGSSMRITTAESIAGQQGSFSAANLLENGFSGEVESLTFPTGGAAPVLGQWSGPEVGSPAIRGGVDIDQGHDFSIVAGDISIDGLFFGATDGASTFLGAVGNETDVAVSNGEVSFDTQDAGTIELIAFSDIGLRGGFVRGAVEQSAVTLIAKDITLDNGRITQTRHTDDDFASSIDLRGQNLRLLNGAFISSSNEFLNDSAEVADIRIEMDQSVSLADESEISSTSTSPLDGSRTGNILITASDISLNTGSDIQLFSRGRQDNAQDDRVVRASTGKIEITAERVDLSNGSFLRQGTSSHGSTGDVVVNAGAVTFSHLTPFLLNNGVTLASSGVLVSSVATSRTGSVPGSTGNILINAENLQLEGGLIFNTSSVAFGETASHIGNVGDIRITSDSVSLRPGMRTSVIGIRSADFRDFSNELSASQTGSISIDATSVLTMEDSVVHMTGLSPTGSISLTAEELLLGNGAAILSVPATNVDRDGRTVVSTAVNERHLSSPVLLNGRQVLSLDNATVISIQGLRDAGMPSGNNISLISEGVVSLKNSTLDVGSVEAAGRIYVAGRDITIEQSNILANSSLASGGTINLEFQESFAAGCIDNTVSAASEFATDGVILVNGIETAACPNATGLFDPPPSSPNAPPNNFAGIAPDLALQPPVGRTGTYIDDSTEQTLAAPSIRFYAARRSSGRADSYIPPQFSDCASQTHSSKERALRVAGDRRSGRRSPDSYRSSSSENSSTRSASHAIACN